MGNLESATDRYRRIRLLGEGGAGQVWLVEERGRQGTRFALKEARGDREDQAAALRREFGTLARLRHPGIVEVYDFDHSPEGNPRFTQDFVDGESLAAAVGREGAAGALQLAAEALRVLAFLHDFDLTHRDLKPQNLLVRRRPRLGARLAVLDLGLAVSAREEQRGGPAGTLPYLAPELFEGGPANPRSDLYALGAVLFEVLFGAPPHGVPDGGQNDDLGRFVERVRRGVKDARASPSGYPPGFVPWILELLDPVPARRPAGAREALARLNATCSTAFAPETPVSRASRLASDPVPGREAEFGRLWSSIDPPTAPRVVWLLGPAGGGKSRMLRWLRTHAIERGWSVATPGGLGESEFAEALSRWRRQSERCPTLVVLDEVESAAEPVARFLDRVAREGRAAPLQVVAAARPGETTQPRLRRLIEDTATVPTLRRVELPPLDRGGVQAMTRRALGGRAVAASRLRWLVEASEGNALTIEALLVDGVWESGGRGRRSAVVERSVLSRLRLLSEPGRGWLRALSVLGPDMPESAIARLAELADDAAATAAEESRLAGLARVERGRWSPESTTVAELSLGAAAAKDPTALGELNRRAAELLAGFDDADPGRLAILWAAAGEPARAIEAAVLAADRSLQLGAPDRAASQLALALRQSPRTEGAVPTRLELRRRQATALMSAGLHRDAARAWGAALRLAREPRQRADLLGRQAEALVRAGRFERARAAAQAALRLAGDDHPTERARAECAIGVALGRLGREAEALPLLEAGLDATRRHNDPEAEAEALHYVATCKARLQRGDAEQDFLRAIELYRKLGHRGLEMRSLIGLATIYARTGERERARDLLDEVRHGAADSGHLDLLETAQSKLAGLAIESGRFDRALALSQEALDQALHLGDRNRLTVNRCRLAEALIACGRPAEAVQSLRDALHEADHRVEPDMLDTARVMLANALMEVPGVGDDAVATPLARGLEGFRQRRKVRPLLMALVIEMERRGLEHATDPLEPVYREFEALAAGIGVEPEIRLRADLAHGAWLLRRNHPAGARDDARSAAATAAAADMPAYAARAQQLLGQSLEKLSAQAQPSDASAEGYHEAFATAARMLEEAARRIDDPDVRRSFLDRPVYRDLHARETTAESESERRLLALYDMIRALNTETDPDALLEAILDMAIRVVSAQRGMVLLRDPGLPDHFVVHVVRGLEQETQEDALRFSRNIVAQAGAGQSVLALDAGEDARFRDLKSVSLYGIRSLMCVPLRSRGTVIGTVYLDCRDSGTMFTRSDLRFAEAFADHAAIALANARERAELLERNRRLQSVAETRVRFGNIVGRSAAMQSVFDLIEKVAGSDLPVLVTGESGTGKELVARAIHFHGRRKRRVLLSENCAAIPETLLESELFGHVRGAFTGADRERQGLFEQADGGTLFLDEVGDMSPAMQARLLRVLQEGELRRVGGSRTLQVDVRVIAATHRDLGAEVAAGRFREDLLYRLQVLPVALPPLRENPEDIGPLIDHFLERIAHERGRPTPEIGGRVRAALERFDWPGNVRQLENTLQRMVLLAGDLPISMTLLESDDSFRRTLLPVVERPTAAGRSGQPFSFREAAREQLRRALEASDGNREKAARLLGVSRATIYRKIRDLGLREI